MTRWWQALDFASGTAERPHSRGIRAIAGATSAASPWPQRRRRLGQRTARSPAAPSSATCSLELARTTTRSTTATTSTQELPKLNAALCLTAPAPGCSRAPRTSSCASSPSRSTPTSTPSCRWKRLQFHLRRQRAPEPPRSNATGRLVAAVKRGPTSTPRVNGSVILRTTGARPRQRRRVLPRRAAARRQRLGKSYQPAPLPPRFHAVGSVPASLLFQLAGPRAATNDTIWAPQGDDFDGIVDWLAIGSPKAMETYMGAAAWWAAGALAVRPGCPTTPSRFRSRCATDICCTEEWMRRFELPACRIDHRGFCRYPGEVAALVSHTATAIAGCALGRGVRRDLVDQTCRARRRNLLAHKGLVRLRNRLERFGLLPPRADVQEWRRRCTTHAAPKAAPAGRARGLPGRG